MSQSRKERIIADLQQAKQTGELKTEKIREIVKNAIAATGSELQEGKSEIIGSIKDAIAAITETFQEKSGEIKEEIAASIEGVIDGVSTAKREQIAKTQSEIKTLEAKVEVEEAQLQEEIDGALTTIQSESEAKSDKITQAIAEAIVKVRDSEQFAALQKQYAELKAQIAVLQANLASRYGEQYEEVSKYLNEAKAWYEKAKEDPEVFTEPVQEKRANFEKKLGEAGGAVARKEKQIKLILQELWREIRDIFREKSAK